MNTLEKMTLDTVKTNVAEAKRLLEDEYHQNNSVTDRQKKIKVHIQEANKLIMALDENNKP
jgi:DNA-directed RNA polymerase subunit F